MHELALEARALTKRFGRNVALDGLDLQLQPGESVALLGPAAAGKSTAIRCLAGLARPTRGAVTIGGRALGSRAGLAARRRVGVLGQEPAFYAWMTARELLGFVANLLGVERSAAAERVGVTLNRAGLAEVADRRIAELALPLRQRLGIAQALVGEPDILLLDEPLGWLDPAGRSEVLELLRAVRGATSLLVATADLALAEATCDRSIVLDDGRPLTAGATRALLDRAAPRTYVVETAGGRAGLAMAGLAARLAEEPWVDSVDAVDSTLRIGIADQPRADRELLPVVVATGLAVRGVRRERPGVQVLVERLRGAAEVRG